jgi:beta-fructofuranosidase
VQYFKPSNPEHFVGDCMPFSHDGVFHLYYLLDWNHHQALGGKGGHQWAHASTRDLVHWEHHELAVPLGATGEIDDGSICTGSMFFHEGVYYAFYAARTVSRDGERICLATSDDGVRLHKHTPRPLFPVPPGYSARSFRDPTVFRGPEDGLFHMLVTSCQDAPGLGDHAGCLAHMVSTDLLHWEPLPPFVAGLFGRLDGWQAPECPDYFRWGSHYYILYGNCRDGRTHYLVSDAWNGPWRSPLVDAFDSPMLKVMKTAAFGDARRIGAAFVGCRSGPADDAGVLYAGNAVFRELVQHVDGSLGTKWPAEMAIPTGEPLRAGVGDVTLDTDRSAAVLPDVPPNAAIAFRVEAGGAGAAGAVAADGAATFGVHLRGLSAAEPGYELRFRPGAGEVSLGRAGRPPESAANWSFARLANMTGLSGRFGVEIVLKDDLIDVCIDRRQTLCLRLGEIRGRRMALFLAGVPPASARFGDIRISPLR